PPGRRPARPRPGPRPRRRRPRGGRGVQPRLTSDPGIPPTLEVVVRMSPNVCALHLRRRYMVASRASFGRERERMLMRECSRSPGPRHQPIASIGRGGMAEVLLAVMDAGGGLRKLVVLKRVWPDLIGDVEFLTMFRDEARLAIRLDHPNVVQTYEVIEDAE